MAFGMCAVGDPHLVLGSFVFGFADAKIYVDRNVKRYKTHSAFLIAE